MTVVEEIGVSWCSLMELVSRPQMALLFPSIRIIDFYPSGLSGSSWSHLDTKTLASMVVDAL